VWLAFNWHFNGNFGAVGKAGSQRRAAGDVLQQCSRMKEEERASRPAYLSKRIEL
jgi:hypothetical protein